MAAHSSILAWRIPWTEEPGGLQSMVKDGIVVANGAHVPEQGVDTDGDDRFDITGGTLVAVGGSMGPSPTMPRSHLTAQPFVAFAGQELVRDRYVALCNADGGVICAYKLPRSMMGGAVSLSLPELSVGGSYSLQMCDTVVGARNLGNGLFVGGTASGTVIGSWVQEKLLALASTDGKVAFLDKLAKGDNGGHPMPPPPPFGGDNGGRPIPPPPFGSDNGGRPMPPPPFGGDNGGRPMPPPSFGGDNGGRPMPPPSFGGDNENYGEGNIPGGGWAPIRK